MATRFSAQGWHSLAIDGHDRTAISAAIQNAIDEPERPSLILCRTHIADGAPNMVDTAAAHGQPLGHEEIKLTKEAMDYPTDPEFWVDDSVYAFFFEAMERGRAARQAWDDRFENADESTRQLWRDLYAATEVSLGGPGFEPGEKLASRASSGKLFTEIAHEAPGFIGGSADLAGSTNTVIDGSRLFSRDDPSARDIPFGVREHAMGAVVNGMAIHGGLKPYGATFFVFSDYMRPAVRLSALMNIPSIWVWTHDSIFLGEDGPTHQPIEHLASLRAMPNLWVIRPADANEVIQAWELALNRDDGPVALVLTRQGLPTMEPMPGSVARGAYVIREGSDVTLIATGSEVATSLEAANTLDETGISVRVVSLPCWELFAEQSPDYRKEVLGNAPLVSVEAGTTFGWEQMVGSTGLSIGIDHFGASAPADKLAEEFGLTAVAIAERVLAHLEG